VRESSRSSVLMRHHGGAASWIVASFLLICLSPLAFGAQLDVEIGIGGYVSRWSYAPVRVTISGLSHPVDGRIRLAQLIGNPTEDPAHIGSVVYAGKLVDRTYEATIPIYDPLNPVRIEVDDGEGSLAVCGISLMPVDDTVLIDPSELPRDWWGFDAVRELWIGGSGATEGAWTTIGEWVTAGGSLCSPAPISTGLTPRRAEAASDNRSSPRDRSGWYGVPRRGTEEGSAGFAGAKRNPPPHHRPLRLWPRRFCAERPSIGRTSSPLCSSFSRFWRALLRSPVAWGGDPMQQLPPCSS